MTSLTGATCGDLAGALLADLATATYGEVTVSGGELLEDVVVVIGSEMPFERPAFQFTDGDPVIDLTQIDPTLPIAFSMSSVGISADYSDPLISLDLQGPMDLTASPINPCETAFWVHLVDADADGAIDPHPNYDPSLGLLNIWPRA